MSRFNGFPEGKVRQISIPETLFQTLLPEMDHLPELKLTLLFFWRMEHKEGPFRFFTRSELEADEGILNSLGYSASEGLAALKDALDRAVHRGILLETEISLETGPQKLYFLNSPKGRAAIRAIENGSWRPVILEHTPAKPPEDQPNIFKLYEEKIGHLSPMIADSLTDAEDTYPLEWIEEAMEIAVRKNKRSLKYIIAILDRWQREGKYEPKEKSKDRPDSEKNRRKYVEGEYSDFIEH